MGNATFRAKLLRKATILQDTALMRTQFPEWLLIEMEQASELLEEAAAALAKAEGPDVFSFDPTPARETVTIHWPDGAKLGYKLDRSVYTNQLPTDGKCPECDG